MSDEILRERRGRVLVIMINRPDARNAVNLAVSQGLAVAVDELDGNPDLSVAVLTGAGQPHGEDQQLGSLCVAALSGGFRGDVDTGGIDNKATPEQIEHARR